MLNMSGGHVDARITRQHHLTVCDNEPPYILLLGSGFDFCPILIDALKMNLLKLV